MMIEAEVTYIDDEDYTQRTKDYENIKYVTLEMVDGSKVTFDFHELVELRAE